MFKFNIYKGYLYMEYLTEKNYVFAHQINTAMLTPNY